MKLVYLAGPIQNVLDPATWRREATALLPKGWRALNPLKLEKASGGTLSPRQIVELDIDAVYRCRALIAKIKEPSWGTAMEIRWAHTLGIPVFGFDPPLIRSPWLTAHVDKFFLTCAEAIAELKNV